MSSPIVPLSVYYRYPALSTPAYDALTKWIKKNICESFTLGVEFVYYVEFHEENHMLSDEKQKNLYWLLRETFEPEGFSTKSFLKWDYYQSNVMVEVGPRLNFSTPWSSNAVSICDAADICEVKRIERSRQYVLTTSSPLSQQQKDSFIQKIHDRMTEQVYENTLKTFRTSHVPKPVETIKIMEEGQSALEKLNQEMGLGFDAWDLEYYTNLFLEKMKRNPTNVECFDMAQSNSEHSRHWFFNGKIIIDGKPSAKTLFQMVKETLTIENKKNSVIAFHDNSSVIEGYPIETLITTNAGYASYMTKTSQVRHHLLTAETHNFPSAVAPFPGAETGTGGRIRDVQATGRGAHVVAGISSYAVGNLNLEDYDLPWENKDFSYPQNLALPSTIVIEASSGASDYGNKFGEPVITGFTRSFGLQLPNGERREYIKPIMFSAGVGQIDDRHIKKGDPEAQLVIVKIGGPAYRIGMGGGAASSRIQDVKTAELDFNAVQRGDAQMENRMNRVIRGCIELGDKNPIVSIHDQGAGGNGNVLKEIVEPTNNCRGGARYDVRNILVGDQTLSVLEIWGAEYQENNALLIKCDDIDIFVAMCKRENCFYSFVGNVTGDGRVVLYDSNDHTTPVDLDLDLVLGKMPQKTFNDIRQEVNLLPLQLPIGLTVSDALDRVFRLLSVGSKRFLTTKVDRSVTGLIAQQQCVGPLHIPLADVGVISQSHFPNEQNQYTGCASACGEQPIKGLINPAAMARLTVGEALTNLIWAQVTSLEDCKCSANWMWAAKLPGEAAAMYDACEAMCDIMHQLGVAVDGGKDSLSMAAKVDQENVKAPGTLVVTMYASCPDISLTLTPDFKTDASCILFVDLSKGKYRLGGSALAQVYSQLGDECPDLEDAEMFKRVFKTIQDASKKGLLLSGHDRSDGGLITTLCEMAFAGNRGIHVDLDCSVDNCIPFLFAEELGLVIEVSQDNKQNVSSLFQEANIPFCWIGTTVQKKEIIITANGECVLNQSMLNLRDIWESTSFELERHQANPSCVTQEQLGLRNRCTPQWKLTFTPIETPSKWFSNRSEFQVAIVREEGSNGDREMLSAFYMAGFTVWDFTMHDLICSEEDPLEHFRGVVFVGGFSFGDVLGSAKGWAGVSKFNKLVWRRLEQFRKRQDTFSLGVCNGCQLMTLLGWVPGCEDYPSLLLPEGEQPRFIENLSGRFESRFVSVKIERSPAILLQGMEGSTLGVWSAHGEGRIHFPQDHTMQHVLKNNLAPLRYVDDTNNITEVYPFNPNGSVQGIAALCSSDGRHLCMMPHPERSFLKWQFPWLPEDFKSFEASPWLKLFQNARKFCETVPL